MSFFDYKNTGTIFMIAGILVAIGALAALSEALAEDAMTAITPVGVLLFGTMATYAGHISRKGNSYSALGKAIIVIGMAVIAVGFFEAAGALAEGEILVNVILNMLMSAVIGIMVVFGGIKIGGESSGKIGWVLMIIGLACCLLSSVSEIFMSDPVTAFICILNVTLFVTAICAVSGDVRRKMWS